MCGAASTYLRGEVAWLCRQFDRLDVKYWKPATNFILFETRMPAEDLNQQLLERGFLLRTQTRNNMPYGIRVSAGHAGRAIKPSFTHWRRF